MTQIMEHLFDPDKFVDDDLTYDVAQARLLSDCVQTPSSGAWLSSLSSAPVIKKRSDQIKLNVHGINMQSGSLKGRFEAIGQVLRMASDICPIAAKHRSEIMSCTPARRCNSKHCNQCANPKYRQGNRYNKPEEKLLHGHCNFRGTQYGKYSSNFQVRNGQRMLEPFDGLPLCFLFATTVNLGCVPLSGDLTEMAKQYKVRLRRCYANLSRGAIIRGFLDIKLMYLDETEFDIPDTEKEAPHHTADHHRRIAMLHAHIIVFDPQKNREAVRDVFVAEFPSKKRVCIRRSWEDIQCADGHVVKGLAGYAEYSSLEKVECEFGTDNGQALLEFIKIDNTWDGRSKFVRFGKRTTQAEALFDQEIMAKYFSDLEHKAAIRSWKNADASSKFIHIWRHHSSDIMEAVKALNKHSRVNDNNELLRNFVGFLSNQTFDQLADIDKAIADYCIWYSMFEYCIRDTSDTLCKPSYIINYSNSSCCSTSQHSTFAGFVNSNNPYICEKHAQLMPP